MLHHQTSLDLIKLLAHFIRLAGEFVILILQVMNAAGIAVTFDVIARRTAFPKKSLSGDVMGKD